MKYCSTRDDNNHHDKKNTDVNAEKTNGAHNDKDYNDGDGNKKKQFFTFEEAICLGYAPDGGLFVPERLPKITDLLLREWITLTSYPELVLQVLRLFVDQNEINDDDLKTIVANAFPSSSNKATKTKTMIPVRCIGSYHVAELFHGPTFCFKDFSMKMMIELLSYFAKKNQKRTTLIVATTGDTGPAAVNAVHNANNPLLNIIVHYPNNQISAFQRKQLTTYIDKSEYVTIVSFEGGGDDMDRPIKNILNSSTSTNSNMNTKTNANANATDDEEKGNVNINGDENGRNQHLVTGVNSYNIGRPLMQMVHFIWTYLRIAENLGIQPGDPDRPVDIVLPTGAMGNITGAYMCKLMGVPLGKLNAAVNINDVTYRVICTGKFYKIPNEPMHKTLSEAINIQLPYNFERILYYLTKENATLVNGWMKSVEETNRVELPTEYFHKLQHEFRSERITDDEVCNMIRSVLQRYNYYIDPHTAVAFCAAQKLGYHNNDNNNTKGKHTKSANDRRNVTEEKEGAVPTLATNSTASTVDTTSTKITTTVAIFATASPCKFEEAVTKAIGQDGWSRYFNKAVAENSNEDDGGGYGYPKRALGILNMKENSPIQYKHDPKNATIEEVQMEWEKRTRSIIFSPLH